MNFTLLLKGIIIATGVFMLFVTIRSLAKRKMHETFCIAWLVVSMAVVLAGIILQPSELSKYISGTGLLLILVILFGVLYAAYFISLNLSDLIRKNQELAIQVSLLNQENERILRRLAETTNKDIREL